MCWLFTIRLSRELSISMYLLWVNASYSCRALMAFLISLTKYSGRSVLMIYIASGS
jgi:hypothetical protein